MAYVRVLQRFEKRHSLKQAKVLLLPAVGPIYETQSVFKGVSVVRICAPQPTIAQHLRSESSQCLTTAGKDGSLKRRTRTHHMSIYQSSVSYLTL